MHSNVCVCVYVYVVVICEMRKISQCSFIWYNWSLCVPNREEGFTGLDVKQIDRNK